MSDLPNDHMLPSDATDHRGSHLDPALDSVGELHDSPGQPGYGADAAQAEAIRQQSMRTDESSPPLYSGNPLPRHRVDWIDMAVGLASLLCMLPLFYVMFSQGSQLPDLDSQDFEHYNPVADSMPYFFLAAFGLLGGAAITSFRHRRR